MTLIRSVWLLSSITLTACDSFHGPSLRNETGSAVEVSVSYSDEKVVTSVWQNCQEAFLGKPDAQVSRVIVKSEDKEYARIEEDEIGQMLKQESAQVGYHVWVVKEDELVFVTEQSSNLCLQGTPRT